MKSQHRDAYKRWDFLPADALKVAATLPDKTARYNY